MRIPRVYTPQALAENAVVAIEAGPSRHIARVLRLGAGDVVDVFDGRGNEYRAEIVAAAKDAVQVRPIERLTRRHESPLRLILAQGVCRSERMDYAIQKAVELGVDTIVPVLCRRSVVRLDRDRAAKRLGHWQAVVISACEQCGRNRLPELRDPIPLAAWLQAPPSGLGLVLKPGGEAIRGLRRDNRVTLVVGPEGGLDDAEVARAEAAGYRPLGLGPRILRSETAGIAAMAALQALWGDLGGS